MEFQIVAGVFCILFALWLWPKWKRARRRRELSDVRVRRVLGRAPGELWLEMNVWFSLGLGLLFIGLAIPKLVAGVQASIRERRLARFEVRCEPTRIAIANHGEATRWLKVDGAKLLDATHALYVEPESWSASAEQATLPVSPGGIVHFRVVPCDEAPCRPGRLSGFAVSPIMGRAAPACRHLEFRLRSSEVETGAPELEAMVSCTLGAR